MNFQALNKDQGLGVSDKYQIIQTGDLVAQLAAAGYQVTSFSEQRYAKPELKGYGKHALRLRHESMLTKSEGHPEIVLRNSYNGTSSFAISLGFFRLVCSNGLIAGKTYSSYNVRHIGGSVVEHVINATNNVLTQAERMTSEIDRFKSIATTDAQREVLARAIAKIVAPDNAAIVRHTDLLRPRRSIDQAQDLWTVLNVVQENSINGGLRYTSATQGPQGTRVRNGTARSVRSIDRNFEINQAVWDYATQLADHGTIIEAA